MSLGALCVCVSLGALQCVSRCSVRHLVFFMSLGVLCVARCYVCHSVSYGSLRISCVSLVPLNVTAPGSQRSVFRSRTVNSRISCASFRRPLTVHCRTRPGHSCPRFSGSATPRPWTTAAQQQASGTWDLGPADFWDLLTTDVRQTCCRRRWRDNAEDTRVE